MKYFENINHKIVLGRIFSISKNPMNGNFILEEECDGCFNEEYTKDKIVEMFQEAINWIKDKK